MAILHSYNTTQAGNAFGLASMLLVANGMSSYSTSNANYTSSENWFPEYTTAQQLGTPTAAYTQLANGVYERQFQNGIVLVNPSATADRQLLARRQQLQRRRRRQREQPQHAGLQR